MRATLVVAAAVAVFLGFWPAWEASRVQVSRARAVIAKIRHHRARPTSVQWAQTLLFLSGAMKAGATLDAALRLLSEQAPPALRARLSRSGWETALSPQSRVERVLAGDDTAFARAALLMFLDAGGRIGRVLETAASTLQAKGEAEERVGALTAQARASAWVVGMSPFALAALMSVLSPDLVGPMMASGVGRLLLLAAFAMSLLGLWCACRLARVDV